MRVVGIDPGGHTGVAAFTVGTLRGTSPAELLFHEQIGGGVRPVAYWAEGLMMGDHIVCESFRLDGRTPSPDLSPVEVIGYLKTLEGDDITFVQPGAHKSLITNEVLKRAGYYPKRGEVRGGHSTDAIRIALWYIVTVLKHRPTIEACWPRDDSGES